MFSFMEAKFAPTEAVLLNYFSVGGKLELELKLSSIHAML